MEFDYTLYWGGVLTAKVRSKFNIDLLVKTSLIGTSHETETKLLTALPRTVRRGKIYGIKYTSN
jgi:hypothetical protein